MMLIIQSLLFVIVFAKIPYILANGGSSSAKNNVPIYFNESLVSKYFQNDSNINELPIVHLNFASITNSTVSHTIVQHNAPSNISTHHPFLEHFKFAPVSNFSSEPSNYSVNNVKQTLEFALRNIRNNELEIPDIQKIFDSMEFIPVARNDMDIARNMSSKLTSKLNQAKKLLNEMCKFINKNNKNRESVVTPCPSGTKMTMNSQSSDLRYHAEIMKFMPSNLTSPWMSPESVIEENSNFIEQLFQEWTRKKKITLNYKYQYYITDKDFVGCSEKFDSTHFYKNYISAIKNMAVVIIFDIGKLITRDQLEIERSIAHTLLDLLNDENYVHIAFLSNKVNVIEKSNSKKNPRKLGAIRNQLTLLIDEVQKSSEQTNHILGFKHAFEIIHLIKNESTGEFPVTLIYVTQNLNSRNETQKILDVISKCQKGFQFPVVINTIQLSEGKRD